MVYTKSKQNCGFSIVRGYWLVNMPNDKGQKIRKKAVIAGHVCLDITPVFADGSNNMQKSLLVPGSLVQTEGVDIHTGGVVANTGLAMKKFGIEVSLIGKIGQDEFGTLITNAFKEYDEEKELILDTDSSTSYSIVLALPGVDRMFLHNPGANHNFVSEDIKEELLKEAAIFHFGYPPLMKSVYEKEGKELQRIFQKAKRAGVVTSLDLAGVDSSSMRLRWIGVLF